MSKEERNTYKIESDENLGEVQIADEVVAIIAGLAAMEVEGVSSMAGNATRELIAKLGMKSLSKGVKVDVLEGIVTVSLALNLKYGSSIKDTTLKVQEKVKAAIENMTGLTVADVTSVLQVWTCRKKNNWRENMRRSKVREHIFKMLFSIGFDAADADEQIELYLEQVEEASEEERGYMRKKVKDIAAHEEEIDAMINEHTTGWKTGRMNKVDLSVLRLAVYEMKWDDEVPVKVAINEAVELAKNFSGDEGPAFVNGVLGKLA